jgi:hypothetical protein
MNPQTGSQTPSLPRKRESIIETEWPDSFFRGKAREGQGRLLATR